MNRSSGEPLPGSLCRISVIGIGYVGAVTGISFAELGHEVILVDVDEDRVHAVTKGRSPVSEPGLDALLQRNLGRIKATTDLHGAVLASDLTIICVGTPSDEEGRLDPSFVVRATESIGKALSGKRGYHTVVVKSTVLPTTTEEVIIPVLEKYSGRTCGEDLGVCVNPEFLREGSAVQDFFSPDRIVAGAGDERSFEVIDRIYARFSCPKVFTGIRTAEMIKYVSNAFLATRISFANEVGNLCKSLGIDPAEVFKGAGYDARIGPHFFSSGIGFGGSCFPKDLRALIHFFSMKGIDPRILRAVRDVNEDQPHRVVALLQVHLDPAGKKIGVLGLAFKPGTDDVRESRAIPVIQDLLALGADVLVYDPEAIQNFRRIFPEIRYARSAQEVLKSDAVLILTAWPEFEALDFHGMLVIDGRRLSKAEHEAAVYEGVCW